MKNHHHPTIDKTNPIDKVHRADGMTSASATKSTVVEEYKANKTGEETSGTTCTANIPINQTTVDAAAPVISNTHAIDSLIVACNIVPVDKQTGAADIKDVTSSSSVVLNDNMQARASDNDVSAVSSSSDASSASSSSTKSSEVADENNQQTTTGVSHAHHPAARRTSSRRNTVNHSYRDYSQMIEIPFPIPKRANSFPGTLYRMLHEVSQMHELVVDEQLSVSHGSGGAHNNQCDQVPMCCIIRWCSHGRAFFIHSRLLLEVRHFTQIAYV